MDVCWNTGHNCSGPPRNAGGMANINIYAFLIYAFLASDEASYITGALWLVDGDIKCLRKRWQIVPV